MPSFSDRNIFSLKSFEGIAKNVAKFYFASCNFQLKSYTLLVTFFYKVLNCSAYQDSTPYLRVRVEKFKKVFVNCD